MKTILYSKVILKNRFQFKFFTHKPNPDTINTSEEKINYKNVNLVDVKGFGRKFSEAELKKYLDPYGFLSADQYNQKKEEILNENKKEISKIDTQHEGCNSTYTNEIKKLEEIEKIEDPKLK